MTIHQQIIAGCGRLRNVHHRSLTLRVGEVRQLRFIRPSALKLKKPSAEGSGTDALPATDNDAASAVGPATIDWAAPPAPGLLPKALP